MKLIAQVRLSPTEHAAQQLLDTMRVVNAARNWAADREMQLQTSEEETQRSRLDARKQLQAEVEAQFGLSQRMSILVVNAIRSEKTFKTEEAPRFEETDPITYDEKVLKWFPLDGVVYIWTAQDSRNHVPYQGHPRDLTLLGDRNFHRRAELVYEGGSFYLFTEVDVRKPSAEDIKEFTS